MAQVARADLEALLRARKLDSTLTTVPEFPCDESVTVPTGIAELDRRLGGGLPRGQMSEITGPRSSGRMSFLLAVLGQATASGEVVALIDPLDMLDPASAAAAGVDLARLLWVRGAQAAPPHAGSWFSDRRGARGDARRITEDEWLLDRAVKAVNLVLQAGGFGVVALDVGEVPPASLRRLPYTTWLRLQRVVEGTGTVCVIAGAEPVARSAGGVTLALSRTSPVAAGPGAGSRWLAAGDTARGVRWAGAGGRRARRLLGFEIDVRIVHSRWRGDAAPCRVCIGS